MAAISRAKPRMERQSGRLGVTSTSKMCSLMGRRSPSSSPASQASGNSRMPLLLGANPNSSSDMIMPEDTTPLSLTCLISNPPGITAPGRHTGTVCPAATLGAPHTMVRGCSSPTSTVHTLSLSALGWRSQVSTLPTTKRSCICSSVGTPAVETRSTSVPVMARRSANSSTGRSMATYSLSQDNGAFIFPPLSQNWRRKRRSFS
ncbi:MAG: hypothetical protein BWY79_01514 [Actinobacteria bacterium ADurb.Bin444]|nr:MAG: hypothetical protein BWY79_01514 [Actinobacteria bacterium ADurb.Bin444]